MAALTPWVAACSDGQPSTVLLSITAQAPLVPAFLRLWVYDDAGRVVDGRRLPEAGVVKLPDTLVLYPPGGGALRVHARGFALGGSHAGEGTTFVVPLAGRQVHASLTVAAARLPDRDQDGVPDAIDRCPDAPNPEQGPCTQHDASVDGPRSDGSTDGPQPDTREPDGPKPDTREPDAPKPDTLRPDAYRPDAPTRDTFTRDTFTRDSSKPDTFKPDTFKPDTFKPDTFKPDTFKPDTFKPDALAPPDQGATDLPGPDSSPPPCALSGTYTIMAGSTPFPTFAAAFQALRTCGVSGPVSILVAAGTYSEAGFSFPRVPYASPARSVDFIAQGPVELIGTNAGGNYVIQIENDAHDLLVQGFEISGLRAPNRIKTSYAGPVLFQGGGGQANVTLRSLYIHDFLPGAWGSYTYIGGIYMQIVNPVTNITVDGCRFHRLQPPTPFHTQGAISLRNGHREGLYVVGCEFFDIAVMDALNLRGGSFGELLIANNMFALGTGAAAVDFYSGPALQQQAYFAYNTIVATTTTSLGLRGSLATGSSSVIVRNNILRGPSAGTVPLVGGSMSLAAPGYNCLGNATAGYVATSTDVLALPTFISGSGPAYDLHSASGSPCLGQGTPLSWVYNDFDGDARDANAPDIGADER